MHGAVSRGLQSWLGPLFCKPPSGNLFSNLHSVHMSNGLMMPPPSRGLCENEMGLYCQVVVSVRILAVPGLSPIMHFVRVTVLSPPHAPCPNWCLWGQQLQECSWPRIDPQKTSVTVMNFRMPVTSLQITLCHTRQFISERGCDRLRRFLTWESPPCLMVLVRLSPLGTYRSPVKCKGSIGLS